MSAKNIILCSLAISLAFPSTVQALTQTELDTAWQSGTIPFRDVGVDNPFFSQIKQLKDLNFSQGTGNGFFEPDRCVSKAEVVKFALDAAAVPTATHATTPFSDITVSWQKNYIESARLRGFLPQVDSDFKPNSCASRIFSLLIILRAANVEMTEVTSTVFADVTLPEHINAVEYAKSKNIVSGRTASSFAPYDTTYRKEMAKILMNTYTNVLHPEISNDRRPDYETAVRIQTVLDNFGTILTSNNISSSGTPTITRSSFVDLQFVYVDYREGTLKKKLLLSMTKPDDNFRISSVATWVGDENGVLQLNSGEDSKKDQNATVYEKEGSLWLKQAAIDSDEQLFTNTSANYSVKIPENWFFWNRGAQSDFENEALFATVEITESNWLLVIRIQNATYGTVASADTGSTSEENIGNGVIRVYSNNTHRVFLPFKDTKTIIFEAKADFEKDDLIAIVQSLNVTE